MKALNAAMAGINFLIILWVAPDHPYLALVNATVGGFCLGASVMMR